MGTSGAEPFYQRRDLRRRRSAPGRQSVGAGCLSPGRSRIRRPGAGANGGSVPRERGGSGTGRKKRLPAACTAAAGKDCRSSRGRNSRSGGGGKCRNPGGRSGGPDCGNFPAPQGRQRLGLELERKRSPRRQKRPGKERGAVQCGSGQTGRGAKNFGRAEQKGGLRWDAAGG